MKGLFALVLLLATASAQIDTLLPENCGDPTVSSFLSSDAQSSCGGIAAMAASEEDKKQLVVGLLYPSIGYTDPDFLHAWNTAWEYGEPPDGVSETSEHEYNGVEVIQDAWMTIIAVTPILEDEDSGTLLAPSHGEIQTAFNYSIVEPPPEPYTGGDCWDYSRIYRIVDSGEEMTVSLNGNTLGQGPAQQQVLLPYSATGTMDFSAELTVWANLEIRRFWEWEKCVITSCGENGCSYSCYPVCEDEVEDEPYLETIITDDYDTLELYRYGFHVMQIMDTPTHAVVHVFSLAPLNEFSIRFGSAYYKKSEWDHGLAYDTAPYNVLHGTASKSIEKEEFNGMTVERDVNTDAADTLDWFISEYGDEKGTGARLQGLAGSYPITHTELAVTIDPNLMDGECEMAVSSHFERLKITGFCETAALPETTLKITTNQTTYEDGDTVAATITLESAGAPITGEVDVAFQGERKTVTVGGSTTVTFPAAATGVITASYTTDLRHASAQSAADVVVHHEWAWQELQNLVIIALAWFMVYILMKGTVGRWKK
ncbi:hypothetical protein ACFLQ2_03895 [archaeon]